MMSSRTINEHDPDTGDSASRLAEIEGATSCDYHRIECDKKSAEHSSTAYVNLPPPRQG